MAYRPIYQIYAELEDSEPKMWRRFLVVEDIEMSKLAYSLMIMFEMHAIHAYEFEVDELDNFITNNMDFYSKNYIHFETNQAIKDYFQIGLYGPKFRENEIPKKNNEIIEVKSEKVENENKKIELNMEVLESENKEIELNMEVLESENKEIELNTEVPENENKEKSEIKKKVREKKYRELKETKELLLRQVIKKENEKALFTYDFKDNWKISLKIEKVFEDKTISGRDLPKCIEGEEFGIIENCGGVKALNKIRKEKKEVIKNVMDLEELDINKFDVNNMNFRLKYLPLAYREFYEKNREFTKQQKLIFTREYLKIN